MFARRFIRNTIVGLFRVRSFTRASVCIPIMTGACAPQAESVPEHARSEDGRLNQSQCSGAVQFFPLSFTIDEELDAVFLDSLTGLFDRRYAIESLKILNIGEYMPLSIILGDVNGLKLTK